MAQRDGAPRDEWEPRRDILTRRAVEAIEDRLRGELESALRQHSVDSAQRHREMEERFVSHKALGFALLAMLGAVFAMASQYMAPTREAVASAVKKMDDATTVIDRRLAEQDKSIARQAASVEAVMRVTVDGKPRKQAQREWESKTGVPRIDAAP